MHIQFISPFQFSVNRSCIYEASK